MIKCIFVYSDGDSVMCIWSGAKVISDSVVFVYVLKETKH